MRWAALVMVVLAFGACDKKAHREVDPPAVKGVTVSDYRPPPVVKVMDIPSQATDVSDQCAQHIVIQKELADAAKELHEVADQLEQVGAGGGPAMGLGPSHRPEPDKKAERKDGRPRPLIRAKVQRKQTKDEQKAIQSILVKSEKMAEQLDKMSPRELRKKLRELKRGER